MRGRSVVILLGLVVAVANGASSAQVPSLGSYHALVIGNQAYKNLRPLRTPVADATAVTDLLRRDYGFASVKLLTNATRTDMVRALDELRRKLGPNDNLLVYYAGHGWLDRESDRGYWLPVDAEGDSRANWLSNADITDTLRALKAKHVLVVADSCYSGTLTRSIGVTPLAPPDILLLAQKRARTALVSGGLEPVADVGGGRHSVFARAFLDVLRGNSGVADLASLFGPIRRQVLLNATQTPEYADIRQAGHDGGDFIFARAGAKLAAGLPAPAAPSPVPSITKEIVRDYGSLAIRGRLPGIEVWLDEQKIGETERGAAIVLNNVAVGTYRVKARKAGHRDWEREVRVAANQRAEVVIDIEALGPPRVIKGDDDAEMVLVPSGEFLMGSTEGASNERPRRRVMLDAFYIDRYEVTNALYRRFMEATGRTAPGFWTDSTLNGPSQPVVGVSWHDADAYCRWAGKLLPTEAEWEKAARGTDGRKYPWGDEWGASRANAAESTLRKTAAVGSYPGGASPYGAQDMTGNVWEWVADWYDEHYYQRSPERNPTGPESGHHRVLRGGSWYRSPIGFLRSAFRFNYPPGTRLSDVGFRCAKSAQ